MFTPIVDLDQQMQHQRELWREAQQYRLAQTARDNNKRTFKSPLSKRFAALLSPTNPNR